MTRKAIIAGASGLVGNHLLNELLASREYDSVTALLRRPLDLQHPVLTQRVVDFERIDTLELPTGSAAADTVFCCLGTTIKAAGSRAAFRHVDHDYVLAIARSALDAGARQFLLVGSMGADARSPFFYMRVKGQIEDELRGLPYASVSVFRPAYLAGQRQQRRLAEDVAGAFMQRLAFLMPRAYRPIAAQAVARAMLAQARKAPPGFHVIESGELQDFA